MTNVNLVGRCGFAKILDCSEETTRKIEKAGLIAPVAIIGGRPLFRLEEAQALRAQRDAKRVGRYGTQAA